MAFFTSTLFIRTRTGNRTGNRTGHRTRHRIASAAALLASGWAQAQAPAAAPEAAHLHALAEVTITESAPTQVTALGDVPLGKAPVAVSVWDAKALQDAGAQRVSDALRQDASVSDAYNTPTYWDMVSVRGYVLDNRYNYRREGLPISAETLIGMDNKERIELLKGTSGIQAGTSAPGGLVNYVVKRPSASAAPLRSVSAQWGPGHSLGAAVDVGGRAGEQHAVGYRLNAAYEDLNPYTPHSTGQRRLLALALDWRLSPDQKLEWEAEHSERQQLGVNAYSLHGNALPAPVNGKTNLAHQSWSVPSTYAGTTGTLRHTHTVGEGWLWTTQYGTQRLRTDDRLSFAFGASTATGWVGDRFAPDGSFDVYDYRSDNERRRVDALQTTLTGTAHWAGLPHSLSLGLLRSRQLDRLEATQLYSYAGTSGGPGAEVPEQTGDTRFANANRSERSTELHLSDRVSLSAHTSVWLGLRHTQYNRWSQRNANCDSASYACIAMHIAAQQHAGGITTPWLGLSHTAAGHTVYASHGQGAELAAAPNTALYTNAGQLLGVSRSTQTELGVRSPALGPVLGGSLRWAATAFHIARPLAYDHLGARVLDGTQTHQGMEASAEWKTAAWQLGTQAQWLHARIEGAAQNTDLNGTRPLNVPALTLRAAAQYRVASVPGLRTSLRVSHEGARHVTAGGGLALPSWTVLDWAAHWDTALQGTRAQWTLAVDNLSGRRYWRESPHQYGHHYLSPGAPRTLRVGVRLGW